MAKKNNSARDSIRFQVMMQAAVLGITPEELTQFYTDIEGLLDVGANDAVATRENATGPTLRETKCIQTQANGLDDASEKTLKLRVQMQDVTKPPMWRELKVPANFTFYQLHKAIQAVCGFEDAHLWQFQHRA